MRKWVAILFALVGMVLIAYPLVLRLQAVQEQSQLESEFEEVESENNGEAEYQEWPPTKLEIPAIEVEVSVVEVEDMEIYQDSPNHPPGHYPGTALPGEDGNLVITAHREGPANYFKDLDELEAGDQIVLKTPASKYKYKVSNVYLTSSDDISVLEPAGQPVITLITCQREGLTGYDQRLIVEGKQKE